MKLGKLPARHDPRTYNLTAPLEKHITNVPDAWDWSTGLSYDMNGNDTIGDCAFAARSAMVLTWTSHAQAPIRLTRDQTIADYAAATGYDPATGTNDNGTVLLDALNRWRRTGFNRTPVTADFLTAYASLDFRSHQTVRRAIYGLGGAYLGLSVPAYLMSESGTWTYQVNGDWTPQGGHCVAALGYNEFGPRIFTWGGIRSMEWRLWDALVDECYVLFSRENWVTINQKTPVSIPFDSLASDFR